MDIGIPLVSIVLPYFESRDFLREAIESVLAQKHAPPWELLLVNDGSVEADCAVAREFGQRYPDWIQLFEHPGGGHRGASAARNLGIAHARGEYIAFLDADDIWLTHKLSYQSALLQSYPEAAMVYGPALRWWSWNGGQDEFVATTVDGYGTDCLAPGEALLATFLRDEGLTPCTCSVMVRRSALLHAGCFEEEFSGLYDDQVLYAKLCLESQIFVSSECVSWYRQDAASCCGQAELLGKGPVERIRFLSWLEGYRERKLTAHGRPVLARR